MAINFVRGFRRIGWVITIPVAALIVLVFYKNTKEFSPFNYGATQANPPTLPADFFETQKQVKPPPGTFLMSPPGSDYLVELSGMGMAWFSGEVPKDVVERVLQDFEAEHKPPAANPSDSNIDYDAIAKKHNAVPDETPPTTGPWTKYQKPPAPTPNIKYLGPLEAVDQNWTFTVHKTINKLRLTGLILGSFVISALMIQGCISILAWVFRGFKG